MENKEAISELIGKLVTGIFIFLSDWACLKWGWDLLLVKLFPSLPVITWFQALVIMWISAVLFKQRTVEVIKGPFSK